MCHRLQKEAPGEAADWAASNDGVIESEGRHSRTMIREGDPRADRDGWARKVDDSTRALTRKAAAAVAVVASYHAHEYRPRYVFWPCSGGQLRVGEVQ